MAGVKGRSGGLRAGAGRKGKPASVDSQNRVQNRVAKYPDSRKVGLKPFQPRQSGNPGGRPRGKPVTDAYSAQLDEKVSEQFEPEQLAKIPERWRESTPADLIAHSVIEEAIVGKNKVQAAKEITDRVEGKVPLPLMGVNDAPIDITIVSKMARPKRGNAGRMPNPGSRKPNGDH